jgi:hypothetical protein
MELFLCTTGLGTKLVLLEALLGPSLASISDSWTQAAVIVSRIALVVWLLDLRRMVRCSTSTALLAQNVNTEGSVTCVSNTECNRPN